MSEKKECLICRSDLILDAEYANKHHYYVCPNCGNYYLKNSDFKGRPNDNDKLAVFLFYNGSVGTNDKTSFCFISPENINEVVGGKCTNAIIVNNDIVENWYPHTFSEKVDMFLLMMAAKSHYVGDLVLFTDDQLLSACFAVRESKGVLGFITQLKQQCSVFLEYLIKSKYISHENHGYVLQPDGWKRVDTLQKSVSNNKNVFVSMAFNDGTKDTREAIRQGIIDGKFSPQFIDEIIHNKQIVPEMFRLIRESRFLILDISEPNYGAYYEAGYALGLGKEVIISCKRDVFDGNYGDYSDDELAKFEKYLKPHFDIVQKQILVWDNYEDLTKKLSEWIKALF